MLKNKRLRAIGSMLRPSRTLVDVGADHAYLLIDLIGRGDFCTGIGVEINEGPCRSAEDNVEKSGLSDRIDIRQGDGLEPVSGQEADSVVIAGMGGHTICGILERHPDKTNAIRQLVLQPQSTPERVRRLLLRLGFGIQEERLVQDGERLYVIIRAGKEAPGFAPTWENLHVGPKLLEKGSEFLVEYMRDMLAHKRFVLQNLTHAKHTPQEQRERLMRETECLRELIARYEDR